ncbi:hypothetical protein E6P09_17745 (plasmid) [Haloferax mediterranei ATCC 33500]|uniref:Uncharacterized protein n=1 Tax=Haloferax mediterranei (strain ATCC 33500 / DSM 1411 / JCM 8866 / NBRC 14739 / NCIMB 2177 / R-4) TaxID=523841 RepID=M0JA32_HALMT|nr:hypothetical protein [Haloferax mediterranei]AHZ24132.1 hypothetical protein BM92_18175 [Haloferax mediterranei ATCC 33500]EMA05208.1 hypothetical protein C439_00375 [Haloferax mediterranei ATCC 33500]MDX5989987.1 hypothetical protein [Haloferax mediterranei ATCC 33500]QCQ77170.1 hypothetical protein E6P09_17745 [Haloferax mediterranei ATCC 33500]
MATATIARYTGSAVGLVLAITCLGFAAVHAAAGVPTAVLPAVGGLVLLGAAVALAPVTRRRLRKNVGGRDDLVVFFGALAVAILSFLVFFALGSAL